ncbi:hypothetical protein M9Y10_042332 [Tritrichomonas musculus]|uniref:DUF3447 domain-containing protein n=1 Tax=Tritrichomonas musculus TaxID=1915356 RepID=A0ABR2GNU1_9EUKA
MIRSIEYIEKKKKNQESIVSFIDSDKGIMHKDNIIFQNLIQQLNDEQIRRDQQEMLSFLYIISSISKHHHRNAFFFSKIEYLLREYKKEICHFFTSEKLFRIFGSNKRILLFLIEENFLKLDQSISDTMIKKYEKFNYKEFFFSELKKFLANEETSRASETDEKTFKAKRRVGENDGYICKLIRNDMIDDFINYVNSTNFQLTSTIESSIFETNPMLNKRNPSLIEYSAFFGSIQIFKYLLLNKVELTESLFIYAIHGRNSEIIHLLEENLNNISNRIYARSVIESIKCHHNDLADYFMNKQNEDVVFYDGIKYYNYFYFPNELDSLIPFYYLCKHDYYKIVNFILQESDIEINFVVIFFYICLFKYCFLF